MRSVAPADNVNPRTFCARCFLAVRFLAPRRARRSSRLSSASAAGAAPPLPSGRYTSSGYRIAASLTTCEGRYRRQDQPSA